MINETYLDEEWKQENPEITQISRWTQMHKRVSGEYEMKGDAPKLLQSRHGTGEISVAPLIYGLPSQEQSKTAALQLYCAIKKFDTAEHLHKKKKQQNEFLIKADCS